MRFSTGARLSGLASMLFFGACLSGEDAANEIDLGASGGDNSATEAGGAGEVDDHATIDITDRFRIVKKTADEPGQANFTEKQMIDAWESVALDNRQFITAKETGYLVKVGPNGQPDGANIQLETGKNTGLTGEVLVTTDKLQMDVDGKCGAAKILVSSLRGKIYAVNPALSGTKGATVIDATKRGAQFTDVEVLDVEFLKGVQGEQDPHDAGEDVEDVEDVEDSGEDVEDSGQDEGKGKGKGIRGPIVAAADFRNGVIRFYDSQYRPINLGNRFKLRNMPKGVSPFGLKVHEDQLFVTYARRAAPAKGEPFFEQAPGFGLLAAWDIETGQMQWSVRDDLNVPYGMAMSEGLRQCATGSALLVGNHVEGKNQPGQIRAFDARTGKFLGKLLDGVDKQGNVKPVAIDGLWGLNFPEDLKEDAGLLHFAAGTEADGLFGMLTPIDDDKGHEK